MELFSGIVLGVVVLAIAVYLAKEIFGDRISGLVGEYKQKPARSPNHHLVGSVGTVIAEAHGEDEFLRVRIGIERWNARPAPGEEEALTVGTEVRVAAVEGLVLQVARKPAAEEKETPAAAAAPQTSGPMGTASDDVARAGNAGVTAGQPGQLGEVQPKAP